MRFANIAGINRPVSRVVLGTEDYFLHQYDHHAQILDAWIAGGGNTIDTARLYATYEEVPNSELVVGKWMAERGNRDQVTVITKGAHPRGSDDSGLGWVSREVIDADVFASLEALGTDYIDIWLFHRDNPNVDAGEIMDRINAHISAGRIRAIGASNWSLDRFEAANRYAPGEWPAGVLTALKPLRPGHPASPALARLRQPPAGAAPAPDCQRSAEPGLVLTVRGFLCRDL